MSDASLSPFETEFAAAIDQHRLAVRKNYERRIALTYVEEVDRKFSVRLIARRPDDRHQRRCHRQRADQRWCETETGRQCERAGRTEVAILCVLLQRPGAIDLKHVIDWLPSVYQHGEHRKRDEVQGVDDRVPAFVMRHPERREREFSERYDRVDKHIV